MSNVVKICVLPLDQDNNGVILDWELPEPPIRGRVSMLKMLGQRLKIIAMSARPESRQAPLGTMVDVFISNSRFA